MRFETTKIALIAAAFFVVTSLTIASTRYSGGLALIWPGSGIVAALLVSLPARQHPLTLILLGILSALATSVFGFGPTVAVPLAIINMAEAWAIAFLLMWMRPEQDWLESVAGLQRMVIAIGGGTLLAAMPGGLIAALAVSGSWLDHSTEWTIGHSLGSILSFPLAWFAVSGSRTEDLFTLTTEDLKLVGYLLLVGLVTSFALLSPSVSLLFLPIVPLMYTAFRCGLRGALLGFILIMILSVISLRMPGTYLYNLDFSQANASKFIQFYLAILLMLSLPVSIAIRQYNNIVLELREMRALEGLVAEYSNDALLNLDPDGIVRYCSPAGSFLTGIDEPEGECFTRFFDPLDEHIVRSALKRAAEHPDENRTLELSIIHDDEARWLEAKIRAVVPRPKAKVAGFAVTIRDVTTRKQIELDATKKAETDALTGLANRRSFLNVLGQRLETARTHPFALAVIDLDHFKDINDSYGHTTGDMVLRHVARLMHRLTEPGLFFARIGGEEFILLAEMLSAEETFALCEKLRSDVERLTPSGPNGEEISLTASIGITMIDRTLSTDDAIRAADAPLYDAKHAGRNRVAIAQNAQMVRRASLHQKHD